MSKRIWRRAFGGGTAMLKHRVQAGLPPRLLACLGMAVGGLYLLHLCTAVVAERALYSDGAHFFTGLLAREFAWPFVDDWKHIRLFVNYINQFPAALAIKAGVHDLRVLKLLFGAGLFFTPVLIYAACFLLCRRAKDYRILFFIVATVLTCTMPSDFFILNQAFTTLALCWLLLCYVLLNFRIRAFDWVAIAAVLVVLFRAHEGMLLWGVVLFGAAAARLTRTGRPAAPKDDLHIYLIGLTGLLHAGFVLYWQASHPVGEQTQAFLALASKALPSRMWEASGATRISLLIGVALVVSLAGMRLRGGIVDNEKLSGAALALAWGVAIVCTVLSLQVVVLLYDDPWRIQPWQEKTYRFLINFGSLFWMGVAVVFWRARMEFCLAERRLMQFILGVGLVAGSMWQLNNTKSWHEFQNQSILIVKNSEKTFISSCEIEAGFSKMGRGWLRKVADSWTWPAYSIAIQEAKLVPKLVLSAERDMFWVRPDEDHRVSASYVEFFRDGYFDFSNLLSAHRASWAEQSAAPPC